METLYRLLSGLVAGLLALFAPLAPMILTTLLFIAVDFLSGIAADRRLARREGRAWYFESGKARRTVVKASLAISAISLAWLLDCGVLDFLHLNIAAHLAGFTCGVEFWSFLENASQLSDAPLFCYLRRFAKRRIQKQMGDE